MNFSWQITVWWVISSHNSLLIFDFIEEEPSGTTLLTPKIEIFFKNREKSLVVKLFKNGGHFEVLQNDLVLGLIPKV